MPYTDWFRRLFINEAAKALQVVRGGPSDGDIPVYDGEYEITPHADKEIRLLTAHKYMNSNVMVSKIPYYKTSNLGGGETVYIGTEVSVNGD